MKNLPYSHNAMHDADLQKDQARKECTPGTRKQILEDINQWATSNNTSTGYWMCGMAGTGKSTIACAICIGLGFPIKVCPSNLWHFVGVQCCSIFFSCHVDQLFRFRSRKSLLVIPFDRLLVAPPT